jgi:ketosteroid isomerase-like protein
MAAVVDALLALERRRCDAIARGDATALQALLSDDYVHVHMTGKVDDRAGHIQAVVARPRTPERGPLNVRIYGEVAVLTGELTNRTPATAGQPERTMRAYCKQVAAKRDGAWRFVSLQLTPIRDTV